jgi:thiol-disulfide isomerase/thioredoxin
VSRQKFEGLVGQDLIWCLYCDWMTGVYSLGAEMLRNVESFWCPIRFYDDKKCENCKLDFPDIERGWVAKEGTMEDVEEVLKKMYANSQSSWFGHPEREHPQVEINQDK